jgi:two-component system cell cycle response regulator DivK
MGFQRDLLEGWDILVIDDEPDSLEVVSAMLEFYGATVQRATNGREGLEMIRASKPKLVISDISMPLLDGWGLIAILLKEGLTTEMPVVALTAHAMRGDRERVLAAGFHSYMSKPLTPQNFIRDFVSLLKDSPAFADQLKKAI